MLLSAIFEVLSFRKKKMTGFGADFMKEFKKLSNLLRMY